MGEEDTLQATLLSSLQEVTDEVDDEDMRSALEASRLLIVKEEQEVKGGADKAPAAAEASITLSWPLSTVATTYWHA
jgi:hypothetical protein